MECLGKGSVPEQNRGFCGKEEVEMGQQNPVNLVANKLEKNPCVCCGRRQQEETILIGQRNSPKPNSVVSLSFIYFLILFPQ